MKQTTFESLAWKHKGKVTRREQFLGEMDAVLKSPRQTGAPVTTHTTSVPRFLKAAVVS
jgi:hypothetical protein